MQELNITSWLVRLGLSYHQSNWVKAKMEFCWSHDHFGCHVMDCSATRILSWSITGYHPLPTDSPSRLGNPQILTVRWIFILGKSLAELSVVSGRCCTCTIRKKYFVQNYWLHNFFKLVLTDFDFILISSLYCINCSALHASSFKF